MRPIDVVFIDTVNSCQLSHTAVFINMIHAVIIM